MEIVWSRLGERESSAHNALGPVYAVKQIQTPKTFLRSIINN